MRVFFKVACLLLFSFLTITSVIAQSVPLECGSIIEGEIAVTEAEVGHSYTIALNAGDRISITSVPIGDDVHAGISIYGPDNVRAVVSGPSIYSEDAIVDNFAVSSTGVYTINTIFMDH